MNEETRQLVSRWLLRAREERDPFVNMFIAYMCLDAWITAASGQDRDDLKLDWLKHTENSLKSYWYTVPNIKIPLQGLRKVGKVEDMRPNNRGRYIHLTDTSNLSEVVDFIYQIRCNLFHGGKSYINVHDRDLCRWSSKVLENWLEWTLLKTS